MIELLFRIISKISGLLLLIFFLAALGYGVALVAVVDTVCCLVELFIDAVATS